MSLPKKGKSKVRINLADSTRIEALQITFELGFKLQNFFGIIKFLMLLAEGQPQFFVGLFSMASCSIIASRRDRQATPESFLNAGYVSFHDRNVTPLNINCTD